VCARILGVYRDFQALSGHYTRSSMAAAGGGGGGGAGRASCCATTGRSVRACVRVVR
jgi:hypothetical protein